MIKPIVVHIKRKKSSEKEQSQWTKGLETLIEKIRATKDTGMQSLIETMEKNWRQEEKNCPSAKTSR